MSRFTGEWLTRLESGEDGPSLELVCEPDRPRPWLAIREGMTLVFDGVLYERSQLERSSGLGADVDPAELLLEGYLRRRHALLPCLRGRFALVLWDSSKGELLAVRDPVGVRPLFYARGGGGFVASPYMDLLLRQPGVSREVDPIVATGQMILGLGSAPAETMFKSVRRVPPGHALHVRGAVRELRRYWEPAPEQGCAAPSERFGVLLDQSVRRCHADGRLGVLLSGGLDSATIAAAAAKRSRACGLEPPFAISLFNRAPGSDEQQTQRAVAAALGLSPIAGSVDELLPPGELLRRALELAPLSSWPPGAAAPAFDLLSARAREAGCGTVLAGDGGDEWLLPFSSWAAERLLRLDLGAVGAMMRAWPYSYPGVSRRGLARQLVWRSGVRQLLRGAVARPLARLAPARLRQARRRRFEAGLPDWLVPDPVLRSQLADWWIEQSPDGPAAQLHRLEKRWQLTAGFTSALMEDLFTIGRRLGAEILCPFWDVDLIDFVLGLPEEELIRGGRAKALARDYLSAHLTFAESWPAKTFGDPELARIVEREGARAWQELGGVPTLARLGIVDPDRLGSPPPKSEGGSASIDGPELWNVMALESWLRVRTMSTYACNPTPEE